MGYKEKEAKLRAWMAADPVGFPVNDGTEVTVSEYAAGVLREFGIVRLKAVNTNGKRYLYTPELPDFERRWVFWQFAARHLYHLHLYLPGDGQIRHNGSESFLPSDFSRDEWAEHNQEPEKKTKPRNTYVPKVSAELVERQMSWFAEPSLRLEAVKWAAKLTNPPIADEVVQQTYLTLLPQIMGGQCLADEPKKFHDYVLTSVQFDARTLAKNGKVNGDIIPDLLRRKGITRAMPADESL